MLENYVRKAFGAFALAVVIVGGLVIGALSFAGFTPAEIIALFTG